MKIFMIGGGYAGLAAIIALKRHFHAANITLVDPRDAHLKITRLHQTLRQPLTQQQLPFEQLAERFGFLFLQGSVELDSDVLADCQRGRQININDTAYDFDYLLVSTGAQDAAPGNLGEYCYSLGQFTQTSGSAVIHDFIRRTADAPTRAVTVVGAGASGIQFLFELVEILRKRDAHTQIRLVDSDQRTLPELPQRFDDYVRQRMASFGVEFLPNCEFCRQTENCVEVGTSKGELLRLPSQLSLLFLGRSPQPQRLAANQYGQVMYGDQTLENIFAAGDCVSYDGNGLDKPTAQAAIRKAQHAAENIVRTQRKISLKPYDYQELGYVVSLGDFDAVGWLGMQQTVLTGVGAAGLKTAIEGQYDLLLKGIDTYFDVSALQSKLNAIIG